MRRSQKLEQNEYVLGTHDDELVRLGFQHQLWTGEASRGWERAGFTRGDALLDVGCGPGYATFDLARWVGPSGRVHGVDISERFLGHLNAQIRLRQPGNITWERQDVEKLKLPAGRFEGAFARWVFCFVRHPAAVLRGIRRALKQGSRLVIHDYYQYEALWVAPEHPIFPKVFHAVAKSWRLRGGNPNVGSVLPGLLRREGFEIEEIRPMTRLSRSSEPLWQWPTTFFRIYLDSLIQMKLLTRNDEKIFHREWKKRSADEAAFFSTPPMVEIIAFKR